VRALCPGFTNSFIYILRDEVVKACRDSQKNKSGHCRVVIIFEDEHLLVADKPAGLNTHAPAPFAGEGLYEWLKNGDPRRASLAIIHRLDKETSGLIVFGKTTLANRSLTRQFEQRATRKKYVLLTDRKTAFARLTARSWLARSGEKYLGRPAGPEGGAAETAFTLMAPRQMEDGHLSSQRLDATHLSSQRLDDTHLSSQRLDATHLSSQRLDATHLSSQRLDDTWLEGCFVWEAEPATGRTHQIRVHAAAHGFPILGDTLYGGTPAARVYLHAAQLGFRHPATGENVMFDAPPDFSADPRAALRAAVIDPAATDAFRLVHGAADGWPGLYVDRLGEYLLAQSECGLTGEQRAWVEELGRRFSARGICHKPHPRRAGKVAASETAPQWLAGEKAPEEIVARENGLRFALRLAEGSSAGLFLDQRENRRRLLTGYIAPEFPPARPARVLNAFAYTCGFSVCAAAGGARVTSLDLSRNYLEWGKRNFALNGLDPAAHDFIFGDVFGWFRRLAKKGRLFDAIILDPPTFSRSREHGVFQAEKDYGTLAAAALPLLARDGILLCSANAAALKPERFLEMLARGAGRAGRRAARQHYAPQPPDFPVHRMEPAHLKTVWLFFP
jgi:23S rRNA (cytosine1962-C5)-methyltransferase